MQDGECVLAETAVAFSSWLLLGSQLTIYSETVSLAPDNSRRASQE